MSKYELPKKKMLELIKNVYKEEGITGMQEDAKLALNRSATVFIMYLCASCQVLLQKNQVKGGFAGDLVIAGVKEIDMDWMVEDLEKTKKEFLRLEKKK